MMSGWGRAFALPHCFLYGGVFMSEPLRFTVYLHPIGMDVYTEGADPSKITVLNDGLHLDDARDFCNINNADVEPGFHISYCTDQAMQDFFAPLHELLIY